MLVRSLWAAWPHLTALTSVHLPLPSFSRVSFSFPLCCPRSLCHGSISMFLCSLIRENFTIYLQLEICRKGPGWQQPKCLWLLKVVQLLVVRLLFYLKIDLRTSNHPRRSCPTAKTLSCRDFKEPITTLIWAFILLKHYICCYHSDLQVDTKSFAKELNQVQIRSKSKCASNHSSQRLDCHFKPIWLQNI